MAGADYDQTFSTSSSESYDLLDFFGGLGLEVELGAGVVGLGPGVVAVGCCCSEGDVGICSGDFALDVYIHCLRIYSRGRSGMRAFELESGEVWSE